MARIEKKVKDPMQLTRNNGIVPDAVVVDIITSVDSEGKTFVRRVIKVGGSKAVRKAILSLRTTDQAVSDLGDEASDEHYHRSRHAKSKEKGRVINGVWQDGD